MFLFFVLKVLIEKYIKKEDLQCSIRIEKRDIKLTSFNPKANLNVLNQETCNILGITPSQKMYKKAGFGTFKKAVESIKGSLTKKIKIKNNMVSW